MSLFGIIQENTRFCLGEGENPRQEQGGGGKAGLTAFILRPPPSSFPSGKLARIIRTTFFREFAACKLETIYN